MQYLTRFIIVSKPTYFNCGVMRFLIGRYSISYVDPHWSMQFLTRFVIVSKPTDFNCGVMRFLIGRRYSISYIDPHW
jgi:hypothetical protein